MRENRNLIHPRDEIMETIARIYRYRMTTTSGGNLSIREANGDIWVTPAGVDKGSLTRDDIVLVRADGTVEGPHRPSSEFVFHKKIYDTRDDIRGIVHAHPVALVAFSICGAVPDTRLLHQSRHVCGDVGWARYALPGSEALGDVLGEAFQAGGHCVLLENHGVVVGGATLQDAFQRFETLEFTAKTIIKARMLGEVRYLSDEQIGIPRANAAQLPSFVPAVASAEERETRRKLCAFVRRGYQQRLLISTEGSFSARLDQRSFLITPYQVDRHTLTVDDLVLVTDGAAEQGKTPSRASRNHQAIYESHAEVGAIVNAYTVNATAFSVTGTLLDSRTIPESYVFLRGIGRVPYGVQFTDSRGLASHVSPRQPIAVLENDGVLVAGRDVLAAFDLLEVLESTAEALINSQPLGELSALSSEAITELENAFWNQSY